MGTSEVVEVDGPELYLKQYRAIYDPNRVVAIEASTKAGKTVGCLTWQFDQCTQRVGHHWWVAPIYTQAQIAYERAKKFLPSNIYTKNDTEKRITLINGSVWWFKSGDKPDSLYGEDVQSAVIDEASRCKDDVWMAIRSTLTATRGPIRLIGNVKGRKNWFYRIARRAQNGEPGYGYHKLTAWDAVDAGVLAREEIEDAQRDLPEHVFRELYLAEASEDGGNPFGLGAIERATVEKLASAPAVCFGVDLAKSVDWTVIVGLNEDGHPCIFERFQQNWRATVGLIRAIVSDVPCLVDATGVGDPILEALQGNEERDNFEGFKFTSASKQQIMEGLAVDIQHGDCPLPEGVLVDEMREFEYVHTRTGVRYSAPEGLHDDCVCALALARQHFRTNLHTVWW